MFHHCVQWLPLGFLGFGVSGIDSLSDVMTSIRTSWILEVNGWNLSGGPCQAMHPASPWPCHGKNGHPAGNIDIELLATLAANTAESGMI